MILQFHAGQIEDQLRADGLPVVKDSVRVERDGKGNETWTAAYDPVLSTEQQALADGVLVRLAETKRSADIKAKAGQIILEKYPTWKQLNMERELRRLKDKWLVLPLTADAATIAEYEAAFAWIDSVVVESDRLEADATATANWPE